MFNKVHMPLNRYGMSGKYFEATESSTKNSFCEQEVIERLIKDPHSFSQFSTELSENALIDAKTQLHPLLQQVDLERLGQRREFVQAFRQALEGVVAERIASWLPSVKLVYKFDSRRESSANCWDNSIHLLMLVHRLLPSINELAKMLDCELLEQLKHISWSRFRDSQSVLELQQVTPYEIRHGVCYGAMFYSFYTAPVQVWPLR